MPVRQRRLAQQAAALASTPSREIPSHIWRTLSDAEKIVSTLRLSLDDVHTLSAKPWEGCDLHEKTLKIRVFEVLLRFGQRSMHEAARTEATGAILDRLEAALKPGREGASDKEE